MDELLSEKEQIDVMRSWWKDNGAYVVIGIVIGVGSIFGVNQYRTNQVETQMAASTLFEALAEEIAENRLEPAETLAGDMYTDYPDTIYADQSRLAMARLYMDQGQDQDAADTLRALVDGEGDREMQLVARLRLAKVLQYQGKSADVLSLLDGHTDTGLGARFSEAIGDAHAELGDYQQAEEAYMTALSDPLASQLIDTSLLQMKISDLPDIAADDPLAPDDVAPADAGPEASMPEDAAADADTESAAESESSINEETLE